MQEKICKNCGRKFSWRKKWERDWEQVKYCSKKCQSGQDKTELKLKILELLNSRDQGKSICPSEVLPNELKSDKSKMEEVKMAARLLCYEGKIIITQKNRAVNPTDFKGPIRLKLRY